MKCFSIFSILFGSILLLDNVLGVKITIKQKAKVTKFLKCVSCAEGPDLPQNYFRSCAQYFPSKFDKIKSECITEQTHDHSSFHAFIMGSCNDQQRIDRFCDCKDRKMRERGLEYSEDDHKLIRIYEDCITSLSNMYC